MIGMDAKASRALGVIQKCAAANRYVVLPHFVEWMDERGFFWPDVQSVIDDPRAVRSDGFDRFDRPKWIIAGETADGLSVELVCALDRDDMGRLVVFITIYWGAA